MNEEHDVLNGASIRLLFLIIICSDDHTHNIILEVIKNRSSSSSQLVIQSFSRCIMRLYNPLAGWNGAYPLAAKGEGALNGVRVSN